MADSDDEYDRKRRDKFRGERTESYPREGRRGGGDDRRREDWMERDSWGSRNRPRTDYRDYRGGGGGRERYSPARAHDISPPMKRVRTEWDDRRASGYSHDGSGSGYGNYGSSWGHDNYNSQHAYGNSGNSQSSRELQNVDTQPPMMSFKAFLQTQDDNITDDEAIKKYNEYKLEFKRQQLNEFFVTHKEEEWFKIKYHPEDSVKRKDEQMNALKNRVNVFLEFLDNGRLDKVSVDADQSEQLIRLLDAVVIRLEGGTEHDLLVLDEPKILSSGTQGEKASGAEKPSNAEPGEHQKEEESKAFAKDCEGKEENEQDTEQVQNEVSQPMQLTITSEQVELQKKAKEFSKQKSGDEEKTPSPGDVAVVGPGMPRKRKREYEYESGSESGEEPPPPGESNDMDDDDDEPPPPGLEEHKEEESEPEEDGKKEEKPEEVAAKDEEPSTKTKFEDEGDAGDSVHSMGDKDDDNTEQQKPEVKDIAADSAKEETVEIEETEQTEEKSQKTDDSNKPRPLHRTASIFLRNLAPTITKQEVEAMCKRYPGFLRVAIADPQPERRWFRRGWVTFERQVNIKEICWNLNNIRVSSRLRDCELGAIVNRDLSRRIRTVNGITSHRQVVRHDIKLSARIVHNLDSKCGLWIDEDAKDGKAVEVVEVEKIKSTKEQDSIPSFGLLSKNPVLKNITDYLIEEASAEEEELLGHSTETEEGAPSEDVATVDRDEALIKVLDKLLFYLRIVHSVDYYNHCEYPNEDEMPNRCGIMHARGIPPSSKVTPQELSDYCRTFEQKIASFLQPITKISDEEFVKLGSKDPDVEVEKFIQANTQELAKDKWLCPLSGKKFKGPEFVRKHIFNKHTEKVDEVKKEVEYFNNYLRDPKRPQLAEHPGNRQQRKDTVGEARDGFPAPAPYVPHYQYNYGSSRHGSYGSHSFAGGYSYNQGYNQSYSRPSRGGYNRGRGANEFRPVIHYRDLDAPREPEEFI